MIPPRPRRSRRRPTGAGAGSAATRRGPGRARPRHAPARCPAAAKRPGWRARRRGRAARRPARGRGGPAPATTAAVPAARARVASDARRRRCQRAARPPAAGSVPAGTESGPRVQAMQRGGHARQPRQAAGQDGPRGVRRHRVRGRGGRAVRTRVGSATTGSSRIAEETTASYGSARHGLVRRTACTCVVTRQRRREQRLGGQGRPRARRSARLGAHPRSPAHPSAVAVPCSTRYPPTADAASTVTVGACRSATSGPSSASTSTSRSSTAPPGSPAPARRAGRGACRRPAAGRRPTTSCGPTSASPWRRHRARGGTRGADVDRVAARYRELYPELGVPATTAAARRGGGVRGDPRPRAGGCSSCRRRRGGRPRRAGAGRARPLPGWRRTSSPATCSPAQKGRPARAEGAQVYVGDHPGDMEAARPSPGRSRSPC